MLNSFLPPATPPVKAPTAEDLGRIYRELRQQNTDVSLPEFVPLIAGLIDAAAGVAQ